jgi:hypothetical protein
MIVSLWLYRLELLPNKLFLWKFVYLWIVDDAFPWFFKLVRPSKFGWMVSHWLAEKGWEERIRKSENSGHWVSYELWVDMVEGFSKKANTANTEETNKIVWTLFEHCIERFKKNYVRFIQCLNSKCLFSSF